MILVVSLSPALQRTLEFEEFHLGKVNRARRVIETASGKGVNVARVAKQLGANVRLLSVAGGHRGQLLTALLKAQRIPTRILPVQTQTRFCQTLLGGGAITEIVEEAGALNAREVGRFVALYEAELRKARLVVLTGTVPSGCGNDFYARLIAKSRVPVLVDAQARQLVNAARARPFLVRINRNELAAVPKLKRRDVEWSVVSDGSRKVAAFHERGVVRFQPPRVKALNSVGSGDAMMAGIACALWRGESMREAVRLGIACGAANALTQAAGTVHPADVKKLLRQVM